MMKNHTKYISNILIITFYAIGIYATYNAINTDNRFSVINRSKKYALMEGYRNLSLESFFYACDKFSLGDKKVMLWGENTSTDFDDAFIFKLAYRYYTLASDMPRITEVNKITDYEFLVVFSDLDLELVEAQDLVKIFDANSVIIYEIPRTSF